MHIIWNGLLSKVVVLQEAHGTKDLRFFGVSIGWLGFGFLVGVDRQPTKRVPDAACAHDWQASTRQNVTAVCAKCGEESPRR